VARNRKRAKERRARRPQPVATNRIVRDEAPDPIAHATPDVELAEAQLALGRPDLDEAAIPGVTGYAPELASEPEEDERGFADSLAPEGAEDFEEPEAEPFGGGGGRDGGRIGAGFDGDSGRGGGGSGAMAAGRPGPRVEAQGSLLARLIAFLQGSWRELQRVQWPDRRQVAQATAVVVGFVILAAVFLGLADLASSHLVKFILK